MKCSLGISDFLEEIPSQLVCALDFSSVKVIVKTEWLVEVTAYGRSRKSFNSWAQGGGWTI